MNSSAPTAIKATKMPIWTIFISDLPPTHYYATNSGFFSFLFVDGEELAEKPARRQAGTRRER
jgi:hypothetical protein